MVNLAVADFEEAQRRWANALRALTGGTSLQADNGDGVIAPGEFGLTAAQYDAAAAGPGVPWGRPAPAPEAGGGGPSWSDIGHTALDIGGLIPFAGEVFDGANAIWYAAEGDYLNAGLSTAAMVPVVGWTATGAKYGVRLEHSVDGVAAWGRNRDLAAIDTIRRLADVVPTHTPHRGHRHRPTWRRPPRPACAHDADRRTDRLTRTDHPRGVRSDVRSG